MLWVEIGAKRPNNGQYRTVQWHRPCTVGTVLYKQTVLAPSCTVQIRYGPSRRSKKPKDGVVAQACTYVVKGRGFVLVKCTLAQQNHADKAKHVIKGRTWIWFGVQESMNDAGSNLAHTHTHTYPHPYRCYVQFGHQHCGCYSNRCCWYLCRCD